MSTLLNFLRLPGMMFTLVSTVLLVLTLVNWILNFSDVVWLKVWFALIYLFFMIFGLLNYILVLSPRKNRKKE